MTHALLIAALLAAAPADEKLVPFKISPIHVSVPSSYNHTEDGTTHKFVSGDGAAYFNVDVGKVATAGMKAETCRDKITKMIGGKFKKLTLGGKPGATATTYDKDEEGKNEIVSITYVGCDGTTTWSVIFYAEKAKQAEYAPLAKKIAESVAYPKEEE